MRRLIASSALAVSLTVPVANAYAASFTPRDGVMFISGEIMPGDAGKFVLRFPPERLKLVVLDSVGGSVQDALSIGEILRRESVPTLIPDGAFCMSACAVLFFSGIEAYMGATAQLGVHSAIDARTGTKTTTAPR